MAKTTLRFVPLIALVALALFPMGWLGRQSPVVGDLINTLFPTNRAHAVGHMVMFFTVGLCVLFVLPWLRGHAAAYLALMLLIALGQEAFQLLYKQRPIVFDDIRDLGVDLVAIAAAFGAVRLWHAWRARRTSVPAWSGEK